MRTKDGGRTGTRSCWLPWSSLRRHRMATTLVGPSLRRVVHRRAAPWYGTMSGTDGDIAERMASNQKQVAISEFFEKNKHFLGFDNPARSLITAVKEAVDNSLRCRRGSADSTGHHRPNPQSTEGEGALRSRSGGQWAWDSEEFDREGVRKAPVRIEIPCDPTIEGATGHRHHRGRHEQHVDVWSSYQGHLEDRKRGYRCHHGCRPRYEAQPCEHIERGPNDLGRRSGGAEGPRSPYSDADALDSNLDDNPWSNTSG